MPRRHYDLDEVLALAQSGKVASEIVEIIGTDVGERAIQKAVNKHLGPLPKAAPVRPDKLRRRVIARMVELGLDERVCCVCYRFTIMPMYIRELDRESDDIGSLIFVCRRCKRAGDV